MKTVSTAYEDSGRTRQKQRTRNDLVAAARDLIASGGAAPTVEEAAAAASVSRTTAYRYFRSQRELLVAAHPEVELTSLLPPDVEDDVEARIAAVVHGFLAMVVDNESQQRTMLRLSLADDTSSRQLPLRQGRAIGWFSEALEPLSGRLGTEGVRRLAVAVRAVCGIEALVWLTDVAGLSARRRSTRWPGPRSPSSVVLPRLDALPFGG